MAAVKSLPSTAECHLLWRAAYGLACNILLGDTDDTISLCLSLAWEAKALALWNSLYIYLLFLQLDANTDYMYKNGVTFYNHYV